MSTGAYLSEDQVGLLLKPIHSQRVLKLKGMSYVEGYDIRAELNRVFGFGRWDQEIVDQAVIREAQVKTKEGNPAWNVVYRSRVRLTVRSPDGTPLSVQEATHVGESTHPVFGEAHGNAATNSETYALRRCAINWGDQFGLSLYNKGSQAALVRWTLVRPQAESPADTDDVPQIHAEQGDGVQDGAAPAPADLSGWKARIGAASDSDSLEAINSDLQTLRADGQIGTEDAARVTGMLGLRAADLDRASRNPAPPADVADDDLVAKFKARIAVARPDRVRPMKVEVMRAVSSKTVPVDAGNELLALLKERATALEGAKSEAA